MMKKLILPSLLATTLLLGGAYKIPEQSTKSIGLAGAYVAGANGADAAYFNPANMSFMEDSNFLEISLTGIYLPKVSFEGEVYSPFTQSFENASAKSKDETFLVPHFHFVSKSYKGLRFGLSVTAPAGLSKRWESEPQIYTAKEFSLKVIEINPTFSYKLTDTLAFGAGIRAIYSEGVVKIEYPGLYKVDMEGDTDIKWGYNLALSYRPYKDITFAITYRNRIGLKEVGDAIGYLNVNQETQTLLPFSTDANVEVPLPATLSLAIAFMMSPSTQIEFEYEKTYWSKYQYLDFNYGDKILESTQLGQPKEKNWRDTNTFRIGITHKNSDKLTTLYGLAYDQTPIRDDKVGFELPDSYGIIFSIGALYKYSQNITIGASYLIDYKLSRTISKSDMNDNGIAGEFSDGGAHLLNIGLMYRF
jgi:long-chain fatty acid transport protein